MKYKEAKEEFTLLIEDIKGAFQRAMECRKKE